MLRRHDLGDADRDRIQDLLPGRPGRRGGVGADNRPFLDAVRCLAETDIARTGPPTC